MSVKAMSVKDFVKIEGKEAECVRAGEKGTTQNQARMATQTQAKLNWADVANRVTVPNIAKAGVITAATNGISFFGSLVGAGVFTGLGFAVGGPAGAAMGYAGGRTLGAIGGAIGGYKLGKGAANMIEDRPRRNIVEMGYTEIGVVTDTRIKQ